MRSRASCLFLRAADVPPGSHWLGPAERQHLATLRAAKRKSEWLMGRWTAKQTLLLASVADLTVPHVSHLEVLPTTAGGPQVFLQEEAVPVAISLSHRAGAAFCVVAMTGRVGCDLEWIENRSAAFVRDYFTPSEQSWIEKGSTARRALMANGLWSAKEAVLKVLGAGLTFDTRAMTVRACSEPGSTKWQPFSVHFDPDMREFHGWWHRRSNWILTVVTDPESPSPFEMTMQQEGG